MADTATEKRQSDMTDTTTEKRYNVAVVGATGVVGQQFLRSLSNRNFPLRNLKLFASKRSVGKRITYSGQEIEVKEVGTRAFAGVDLVFAPPAEEMYPEGFATTVDVGAIGCRLEGERRPGHFNGVATVVAKLLAIVRPDRAYFGQKDAQQCLVIKRMSADLNLGAEIVLVPTVREPDGLALSTRNAYLTPDERRVAPLIYQSLLLSKGLRDEGVTDAMEVKRQMRSRFFCITQ